jgi:hypothetical protein
MAFNTLRKTEHVSLGAKNGVVQKRTLKREARELPFSQNVVETVWRREGRWALWREQMRRRDSQSTRERRAQSSHKKENIPPWALETEIRFGNRQKKEKCGQTKHAESMGQKAQQTERKHVAAFNRSRTPPSTCRRQSD